MPWNARTKRRLKLRDLDILATLIDAGSMGKAASRLNVSQPAVSKAIAELESALGVRLVDRGRRGIVPTPYGLALQKRSVAIFNDLRQSVQDIEFLSDPTTGEIRIGTTDPVSVAIVSPCIDRLSRKYPRMSFHVVANDTAGLYREVMERNVELAICRMIGPLPNDLAAEVLFHDALAVLTSARNPLTRRRKLTLAELVNEPWVQLPDDSLFGAMVIEVFRANGYEPPRPTVVTHCMVRPCGARGFVDLVDAVLHYCIRPLIGASAPGPHGYQRACDLILGQALERASWVTSVRTRREVRSSIVVSSSRRPRRVNIAKLRHR